MVYLYFKSFYPYAAVEVTCFNSSGKHSPLTRSVVERVVDHARGAATVVKCVCVQMRGLMSHSLLKDKKMTGDQDI